MCVMITLFVLSGINIKSFVHAQQETADLLVKQSVS